MNRFLDPSNRRAFLATLGSTALGLSGCCMRGYPRNELTGAPISTFSGAFYMAPAASRPGLAAATPSSIDAHAHFFNASDVPVKDYLAQCVAHSASPIVRDLLISLAPIANELSKLAPTAAEELAELVAFESRADTASAAADQTTARNRWKLYVREQEAEAAQKLSEIVSGKDFAARYQRNALAATATRSLRSGARSNEISPEELLAAMRRHRGGSRATTDRRSSQRMEAAQQQDGVVAFLIHMMSQRAVSLSAYEDGFTASAQSIRVTKVLGALVDFDYWLDCPPHSSHDDQATLHRFISARSGGYMQPLIAYNPWSDIELDGEGLRRVKQAIRSGQFCGVKIYPPMGFRPANNVGSNFNTKKPRPSADDLDKALNQFFDYCAQESVVVMAHTNHSAGRDDDHDDLSSPEAWRERLRLHDSADRPLRINLGHFGGARHQRWSQDFATMMGEFPNHQIYGDIGYWDELVSSRPAVREAARARLLESLRQPIAGGLTVADRVMFGTDWFMQSRSSHWDRYGDQIYRWLSRELDAAEVTKIFKSNATKLFEGRL